jgi:hypothetical protein
LKAEGLSCKAKVTFVSLLVRLAWWDSSPYDYKGVQ